MIKKEWLWMDDKQRDTASPHPCGAQGCLIAPTKFLTEQECSDLANLVKKLRFCWIDRGHFFTLGAATYQDGVSEYPSRANRLNTILTKNFEPLLHKLHEFYEACYEQPWGIARPGFHIFDETSNGLMGCAHIDEPFSKVAWPSKGFTNPFSFTMLLEQPAVGAGMDYWPDSTGEDLHRVVKEDIYPPHEHLQYELGVLYTHDGLFPHRIANKGDMSDSEHRITLQGHGLTLDDGRRLLYF
tara:strand:- start:2063 stop:2785 length:723 start_codon:yes stop_codon:yes gene_type:complete